MSPQAGTAVEPRSSERGDARTLPFFVLTFGVAWLLWAAASTADTLPDAARALLFLPGTFAPALVALWLSARHDGEAGVRRLLEGVLRWRVHPGWYAVALGFMIAVKLLAAGVHRIVEGSWPSFGAAPVWGLLLAAVFSTPFQAGEELGWRGWALPRLTAQVGARAAALVLGVVWALWHLPLFYIAGSDLAGQPLPIFVVSVTALSVVMAWLFERTGGSLLLVMLLHAAVNNTTQIVPAGVAVAGDPLTVTPSPMGWATAAVLWLCATACLVRLPARRPAGA